MFCPKCGTNLPDGSAFCGNCGYAFAQAPVAPVAPAAAVAAPVAPDYTAQPTLSAKKRGLTKKHFLATEASSGVKTAGKLSFPFFIVLTAMILLACFITNTISAFELPVVKMAVPESQIDEITDDLKESAKQLDDYDKLLEEVEERWDHDAVKYARNMLKHTQKLVETPSVANFISVTNDYEKLLKEADDSVGDMLGLESVVKSAQDVTKIFKVVRIIIYGFGALIILLTLWAATARKTGLCILCILLFCPICALLSNVLLAVGCFAMFVALAVTTSIVNKAWRKAPC